MRVGLAADHGGFELKNRLKPALEALGHEVVDLGAKTIDPNDDYPDMVIPLARAVADKEVQRGIAICGSGVGACIAANKIADVRAALIVDCYSAKQGVEDDDMNLLCLGGLVVGYKLALELINIFLNAEFLEKERFRRRLNKVAALEKSSPGKS
jgi:ribose 5-phosphate isomerase B